jgi:acetoin:2,6-dichlorophenolindophenol oxidoreductase subunit beta
MASKPYRYALLEGIMQEMRSNPKLWMLYQSAVPTATGPDGTILNPNKEFGFPRAGNPSAIDENWYVGAVAGAAMVGAPGIAQIPSMASYIAFEQVFNQIGKLRHMTGGQASMPLVLWVQGASRSRGPAGQHTDVGMEATYANLPGTKVVAPSDAYDAKGLMVAAIRDPDPVIFMDYGEVASGAQPDVPDDAYAIPFGSAKIRQEGTQLTIAAWAPATVHVAQALDGIKAAGISAEFVDLRSLKPFPTEDLVKSVKKTGKLLVVDHGQDTNGFGSHVVSVVAQELSGTAVKYKKIAFPDAPGPFGAEMIEWMMPNKDHIIDAAKKMMAS